jgi:AraC family transcriptional regulator
MRTVATHLTMHRSREVLPAHEHRRAYLSFVISGEYVERLGSADIVCAPFQVRFHPAGEVHANVFGARGARVMNLELDANWDEEIEALGLSRAADAIIIDGAWPAFRACSEHTAPSPESAIILEESVAALLQKAQVARRESCARRHAIVAKALAVLHQSSGSKFSLFDVARAADVHATHLARVFRREMGCTVGAYARRLRAREALEHMRRYPQWPLSRVAVETGFSDHSHCTRVFRRVMGTTPARMRRAALEVTSTTFPHPPSRARRPPG